jgi:TolA-binding protein
VTRDSIDDLSALSRRGELDETEQRRLKLGLESSFESRLLHRAGLELDEDGSVLPGDDALAERVSRRVLERVTPARAARRRRFVPWAVAAAVACVAAGAAAGNFVDFRALTFSFGTPAKLSEPAPKKRAPAAATPVAAAQPAPVAPAPEPVAPVAPSHKPAAIDSGTAAELFASAASARRKGKAQEAIVLYDTLQSRFPGSAESNAADMALGMLRLQRGAPRSALDHFRRYLATNPRAELAPEALWGQAQALSALGRAEEAKKSFAALIERYPDSTYAAGARAKLESSKTEP